MSTELNRIVGKPIYDGVMFLFLYPHPPSLSLSHIFFFFATWHQIFDIWFEFKYLIRQRETEAHGMMGNGTIRLIVIRDRYARYKYRLVCEKMVLVFGQINDWWYRLQRYWLPNKTVISNMKILIVTNVHDHVTCVNYFDSIFILSFFSRFSEESSQR